MFLPLGHLISLSLRLLRKIVSAIANNQEDLAWLFKDDLGSTQL